MTGGPSRDADAESEQPTDPQDEQRSTAGSGDTTAVAANTATNQPSDAAEDRQRSLDSLLDRLDRTSDDSTSATESEPETADSGFEWLAESLDDDESAVDGPLPTDDHVLLLTPRRSPHTDAACMSLATPVEPRHLNTLFVSLTRSSEQLLDHWQTHQHELPAHLGIVPVGEQIQSTTTTSPGGETGHPSEISVTPATDPSDLTRLGITVNKLLEEWADGGRRTTMCIDSLTTFLQYVEPERLFRFLHLLQSRVDRVDGVAHYHMNPSAHAEETVNIFATLVDTVVTIEEDGTITTSDYTDR